MSKIFAPAKKLQSTRHNAANLKNDSMDSGRVEEILRESNAETSRDEEEKEMGVETLMEMRVGIKQNSEITLGYASGACASGVQVRVCVCCLES